MSIGIKDFRMAIKIDNSDAKQKLAETSAEVRKLEKELKDLEATDKKNTEEYKKAKARLDELNKSYNDLRKEAGLNAMTYDELRKSAKSLKRQLDKTVPDTAEWKELQADLQITRARMKELSGQANETRFSIAKLADGFNRYGTMAATAVASLTGLTLTMRKCVDDYAEMEEAQSQVIKYTGLSKEAVNELNEEFKNMDTRTPRTRLNELAGDAGKLGISTKEGVLEFVEAANMINVALGEDLGKDAITQIGKLAGMFGEGDRSLKENMLAVGSAVNSVAQNSAASEPYLVEFTARMGGVGKQAKLAVTDIMGYASALDQNMLRSEMASTALQGLILKLYQEPAQYAKLAGIEVGAFTKMMEEDANEAVLTFLEALGRLGGMDQMAPVLKEMKLSGAEAAGVIAALAGNVEKVRKEQEGANKAYMEATSVENEYFVQNNTVQAELEKMREKFAQLRVEIGGKLLPVMKYMISTGSLTVKGLKFLVDIFLEYKNVIIALVAAITTYIAITKTATVVTKAYHAITKAATVVTAALNKTFKASPWGLVISGLTAVITYFGFLRDKTDEATAAQNKLNDSLNENVSASKKFEEIKSLSKNREKLNKRQLQTLRSDAESELQIIEDKLAKEEIAYKEYYEKEKARVNARKDINDTTRGVLMGAVEAEYKKQMKQLDYLVKRKDELQKIIDSIPEQKEKDIFTDPNLGSELDGKIDKNKTDYESQIKDLQTQHAVGLLEEEKYQEQLYQITVKYLAKKRELLQEGKRNTAEVDKEILQAMIEESNRLNLKSIAEKGSAKSDDNPIYTPGIIEEETPEEDNYAVEKYKKSLDGQQAMLESFRNAGLISEMEYQDRLLEIETERLNEQERLEKEADDKRKQRQEAFLGTYMNLMSSVSDLMSAMQNSEISSIERKYDKQIKAAEKAGKDTTKLEEEKEAAVMEVKRKYADKMFAMQVLQVTASTAVAAMEAYKAMAGIPFVGPALGAAAAAAAVIAGTAQIAIAKQQHDEAKGLYTGGYSQDYVEGYTKKGNSKDVAGVIPVHKNEFVTNHEGVANPHVKQFLDVFDVAQKNGTIGMINTTQILEQVRTKSGRYSGGYTSDSSVSGSQSNYSSGDVHSMLNVIIQLLRKSNENLSAIAAKKLTVDVRSVRDGIKRVEALERNASR
ncbi:phage tail tape measure protein [Bacteroides caecigallinarum]|uniref:phage tail tape measure protein n=1 Tax=Bacteroides caecigallinarum TaxID=1411144 RepID=UPI001F2C7D1D|nr:phage tail tape measure protein [Bacteroides caecigallinarum]MCF2592873.1 phage tail tape measure protein [Bacteroides caecigallinarum]